MRRNAGFHAVQPPVSRNETLVPTYASVSMTLSYCCADGERATRRSRSGVRRKSDVTVWLGRGGHQNAKRRRPVGDETNQLAPVSFSIPGRGVAWPGDNADLLLSFSPQIGVSRVTSHCHCEPTSAQWRICRANGRQRPDF